MKSLHVLGSRQLGGADRFYIRLLQALNAAGHETIAVNPAGSPVAKLLARLGVPQRHLPFANKWDAFSILRLRHIVRTEAPVAVVSYMGRATRLTRIPAVWPTAHIARLGGYYKITGYYEHCDAWVGNTRGICTYLREHGLPAERVFHIGNFVARPELLSNDDIKRLRARLQLPDDALVLLALGRFIAIKGFDDLLQAFACLPVTLGARPLHLLIVGDGPLRSALHAVARQFEVEQRVHWAGWQDEPQAFFQLADVLICPSRHETLGNVILEGWSHSLPVVCTRTPGALELIIDGENGLLAPCREPRRLAARILDLLRLPAAARAALVAAGNETLQRDHSREAVIAAYLRLFRCLHDRREGGVAV